MSIFFIPIMAVKALCAPADAGSLSISAMPRGTTCHDKPNRSLSQPHCWAFGSPPSESFAQKESISSWVSHRTWNETASLNWNTGPPLRAVKGCPLISNSTVITDPAARPWTSWPAAP